METENSNRVLALFIKGLFLFGALFGISQAAPAFPPIAVAIVCVLLCMPGAITLISITIMRKTKKARDLQEGGKLEWLNKGKVFSITAFFLVSLVGTFALFLEMPAWRLYEWLAVFLLLPVYLIVFKRTSSFLGKEVKGFSLEAQKLLWCAVIVPVLMCILYVAGGFFFFPQAEYQSIQDAFLAHQNILAYSPSAFVANAAALTALFNAFYHYALGVFSGSFPVIQVLGYAALYWALFFTITNMLNFFMIPPVQLRRIVIPLTTDEVPAAETPVQKKYVALPVFLIVFSIASFLVFDHQVKQQITTPGHSTRIQAFVRDRIEFLAIMIDGRLYEYQRTVALIRQAALNSENLREEALREIVPLIDSYFDGLIANVDAYLDWHYSLFADAQRFVGIVFYLLHPGRTVEAFLQNQMQEQLTNGVDEEWVRRWEAFEGRAAQYAALLQNQLAAYRLDSETPAWLVQTRESMSMQDFIALSQPAELMDFRTRFLISAGTGLTVGAVSTVLIRRLVTKAIVSTKLRTGAVKIGSVLAAKAVGVPLGPLGMIAAGAVALGVNYGLLRLDEARNREAFRDEIVQAIEQQRKEVLGALQPGMVAPGMIASAQGM